MFKIFFLCFTLLSLVACGNPQDEYVGLWKKEASSRPSILRVTKEENTYFIEPNILKTHNFVGQPNKPIVLDENGDKLIFQGMTLALLKNGKELKFADVSYKRITEKEYMDYRQELGNAEALRRKNNRLCKDLRDRRKKEWSVIVNGPEYRNTPWEERKKLGDKFRDETKSQKTQIPDCR